MSPNHHNLQLNTVGAKDKYSVTFNFIWRKTVKPILLICNATIHKLGDCFTLSNLLWPKTTGISLLSYHHSLIRLCLQASNVILEILDEIFQEAGFQSVERTYVERRTVNKKENIDVPRIFVQGRYRKNEETNSQLSLDSIGKTWACPFARLSFTWRRSQS